VVHVVKSGKLASLMGLSLAKSIKNLLDRNWEVEVTHPFLRG
ncbi:hypothetical protein A2U01_0091638, partial [Trifolium medium]|nr:hypothetical protein [Trifolium medium]